MIEVNTGEHPLRQQTDDREIDGADEREALQNFADVLAGVAAGTNAGNEAAVLAHVVRKLGRIEHDADIEKRERENHDHVEQVVERFAELDRFHNLVHELIAMVHDQRDGRRKRKQRAGENRRNDAAGIDAQGQVRRLSAHDAASHDALGVLHRNAALPAFDENDEGDDGDHEHDEQREHENAERSPLLCFYKLEKINDGAGQTNNDADKDDEGHAVTDAAFADLFTEPHDEGGAGSQRQNRHQREAHARRVHEGLIVRPGGVLQGGRD